jgi:hypothetical protein
LTQAHTTLVEHGAVILSPKSLAWARERDSLLFGEVDEEKEIEEGHLAAIAESHFVWLHAPAGYVGPSAAMEVGFAFAHRVPVFGLELPADVTLKHFVIKVARVEDSLLWAGEPVLV